MLKRVLLFTRKLAEGNFGRVAGGVKQEINNDANYKLKNQLWVNLLGYVISAPWEMHKLGVSKKIMKSFSLLDQWLRNGQKSECVMDFIYLYTIILTKVLNFLKWHAYGFRPKDGLDVHMGFGRRWSCGVSDK